MVKLFTSKLSVAITLLTLVWVLGDITQRFASKNKIISKSKVSYSAGNVHLPQLTDSNTASLDKFINKYQTKVVSMPKQGVGMSAKEQDKQNGLLNALYIDDNKLQLKAVIQTNKEQLDALLLITNVVSGVQQVEKFSNNTSVYGYQLTIEKNTQVSLTRNTKQNIQKIRLTMYAGKAFK